MINLKLAIKKNIEVNKRTYTYNNTTVNISIKNKFKYKNNRKIINTGFSSLNKKDIIDLKNFFLDLSNNTRFITYDCIFISFY